MAEQKTRPHSGDVGEFLAGLDAAKRADSDTLIGLMQDISGEQPVLWGTMIGFGHYHYQYESGHAGEAFRIGFAPRKGEFSLYVLTAYAGAEQARETELLARLGKHRRGKSCLYVRKLADIDPAVLRALVDEAWRFMERRYPAK
ncbi:DUF1801 domain-containing protein [Devosia sp. YIM 151766]|uniref:DUF1801 domain-containing protein n=1 Tax=Devosia sp. YIM 151766 TaxID=3017325 RepID=UPI00255C2B28|nr:DUF1801 domain-containing protein [Devosia sp. YIM 151766]WIY54370.1 DUF1801 domain-containing protein [Devosia sp. YIM 151766]